jgi:hypothetical protein
MTTKRQLITDAFRFIGLAPVVYDLTAEQLDDARRSLDSMMATWNAKGIRVGFPIALNPDNGDLDEETYLPDGCREAVYTELGKRLAPTFGKVVTPDQKCVARDAYQAMLAQLANIPALKMPAGYPLGAGVRRWDNRPAWSYKEEDPILTGNDGHLTFE